MSNRASLFCLCLLLVSGALFVPQAANLVAAQEQSGDKPARPAAGAKPTPVPKTPANPTDKPKDGSGKTPLGGMKEMFQESPTAAGGPLYIKSDSLELNSKSRVFLYKGNVELVRDDVTITANNVEGKYNAENQLETILCRGNVVITKGEGMRATSNRALYNVRAATVELTEAPELYREGNALSADKVTIFIDEDRSEAEGNVRVKVIKPSEGAGA